MPLKTFLDKKMKKHVIALQEKTASCSMACVCTILYFYKGDKAENEDAVRARSQQFKGYYRPHPKDIHSSAYPLERTFISQLIQIQNQKPNTEIGVKPKRKPGSLDVGGDVLASYHIYSDKQALDEIYFLDERNLAEKLKGKITVLAVKTANNTHHSIIIQDVRDDGTFVIYDPDPEIGLIETKNIKARYDLFWDDEAFGTRCDFVIPHSKLEKNYALNATPNKDEVIASHYQSDLITRGIAFLRRCC